VDQGVPKIVIVITDGESDNNNATLSEAKKLKDRGYNIVSIGIGDLKEQELIDMASSPNDVFKVDDFDKVLLILSSISLSACQQPAIITEEKEIKSDVAKNSYKYFKYSLEDKPDNFTIEVTDLKGETEFYYSFEDENPKSPDDSLEDKPDNFTIEVTDLKGETEFYYSFEDENPKSPDDFIKQNTTQTDIDMNFIEKNVARASEKKKSVLITRPLDNSTDFLFIGVKGVLQTNEFQLQVYDKFVVEAEPFNPFNMLIIIIAILSTLLVITIILLVVVLTKNRTKKEKYVAKIEEKSSIEMKRVGKNWTKVIF